MELTQQEFDKAQHLFAEAKELSRRGLKQEASIIGVRTLHIFNQAAVRKIETGDIVDVHTNSKDVELVYSDLSVPMPVEPGRPGYNLLLCLVKDSPLAQEVLAVLKKYEEIDYPKPQEDKIDLDRVKF